MFNARLWSGRIAPLLVATLLVFHLSATQAVPFSSDISITGNTTFDDGFSSGASGDFSLVSGTATTTSTYAGSGVTGANPLSGSLTDLNDGFGFTGTASATNAEFAVGLDTNLSVTNNSSDIYTVIFKLNYSNMVNADGSDAFADSEITLVRNSVDELFFSDLISDTFYGDEIGGNSTGGAGDVLSESGDSFFSFELNPADVLVLDLSWTLEGGDFTGGLAEANLSTFLSVASVEKVMASVPLPATLLLLGSGIILLTGQRRFQLL